MNVEEMKTLANREGWTENDLPEWANNSVYIKTISSGYLQPNETPNDMYRRLASAAAKHYGDDYGVVYPKFLEVLMKGWMIPSTPVAANFGTERGLPISCFAGHIGDDMYDIFRKNTEMAILSKHGGGTSYDLSSIRPIGSPIKKGLNGTSDGIIPFSKVFDSTILASKQGDMRRGAVALYLNAEHKEYESFLEIREPKGDVERQCHNIHQGSIWTDDFMNKVVNTDGKEREIWLKARMKRVKTGEPYDFFIDNANARTPDWWKKKGLKIRHSNLCAEMMLPTDAEHTLVCCLSSMDLTRWDEWSKTDAVFTAILFLDAVIQEFIDKAEGIKGIEDALRFANKSRALGLGALGWHSFLQSKKLPFISIASTGWTRKIFTHIRSEAERATKHLFELRGEAPEWCEGQERRNLTLLAIAPNRSSSKLARGVSQGIEPWGANLYMDDDSKSMHLRKNYHLEKLLIEKGMNTDEVWDQISEDRGSVVNLDFLSPEEKEIFLTFKEINQLELVRQAAVRDEFLDQGQSVNLAFFSNAPAKWINKVHLEAWKLGLRSLYYFRSESNLRGDNKQRDLYSECVNCAS
jgi:ribonucleoside-diphosphate reductase alpha chain